MTRNATSCIPLRALDLSLPTIFGNAVVEIATTEVTLTASCSSHSTAPRRTTTHRLFAMHGTCRSFKPKVVARQTRRSRRHERTRALAPGVADARLFTTRGYRSLSSPLSSPPSFDRHAHRFPSPPHPLPVYPCVTRRRQERDARAGDCRLLGRRARAGNARHYHDVHHDYGFCGN